MLLKNDDPLPRLQVFFFARFSHFAEFVIHDDSSYIRVRWRGRGAHVKENFLKAANYFFQLFSFRIATLSILFRKPTIITMYRMITEVTLKKLNVGDFFSFSTFDQTSSALHR